VAALTETVSRPPYVELESGVTSQSGVLTETYTFPTGMWSVDSVWVWLSVADPTEALLPANGGTLFHASSEAKWIENGQMNVIGRYNAATYIVNFEGFKVNFVAGDELLYNNFDVSGTGSASFAVYVLAQRLR